MRLFFTLLLFIVGCSNYENEYNIDNLSENKDGIFTDKFSNEEVNGKVYEMFGFDKKILGNVKNGKIDGLWIEWYENGQKRFEETWKDGKEEGLSSLWYENGQKSFEATWVEGQLINRKLWNEDGSHGSFITDSKTGTELIWLNDEIYSLTNQKPYTGYFISYFDSSNVEFEGNFVEGKKDDLLKRYYENGQLYYEVNYNLGIKHGRHTMYYENGNLSEEGNFIDGKEEGIWVTVDSLGYINKGNYKNGKREGIWYWYYVDSKTFLDTIKVEEELYKEGILIETKSTIPQSKNE